MTPTLILTLIYHDEIQVTRLEGLDLLSVAKSLVGATEKNCVYLGLDFEDYWIEKPVAPGQPGILDPSTRLSTPLKSSSNASNLWVLDLDTINRSLWRQQTDVLPNCGDQAIYDFESTTYDLSAPKMCFKTTLGTLMQGTMNVTAWDKNKLSTESDRIIGTNTTSHGPFDPLTHIINDINRY